MLVKPKVVISACLLGEYCRYDGATKKADEICEAFKDYEIIAFCPEAPLFGVPRQRISVVNIGGENKIYTDETKEDVTILLEKEINLFIEKFPHADAIVLKSKSPSCGLGSTPIYNLQKEIIFYGDGIAASIFKERFPHAKICDETNC